MRVLVSYLLGIAFAMLTARSFTAETNDPPPLIVIVQFPDYPLQNGSRFPGGLVAVLWSDGRLIRPANSNTIGKAYVEGVVSASERKEFSAFINQSPVLRNLPTSERGIPHHQAFQQITLHRDGKQSSWRRDLPDSKSGFDAVEGRLRSVSLERQRPADDQAGWRWIRYE